MALRNTDYRLIEKTDFSGEDLTYQEFENCTFKNCNFSGSDLSHSGFIDCVFDSCNFSLAKVKNTALKNVKFRNCKLLGLNFNECSKFLLLIDFEDCQLNLASFFNMRLKSTKFVNCSLQEVDFTRTDLSNSLFDNCDFNRALFELTVLEKADFRTSFNYSIDPEINRLRNAKFSRAGIAGLLAKYYIEIE